MQFSRNGNIVTFTDTDGIDFETWHKIMLQFQYLGYDFMDETDVKTYFDRHTPLQEDQSLVFLRIIGAAHVDDTINDKIVQEENRQAKNYYGLTNSFHKAGYMLPNGDMLDFSEGQWQRTLDHRDIHNAIENEDEEAHDTMYRFIAHGNIRMLPNGFHVIRPPTKQQWTALHAMVKSSNYVYVEITNTNGHTVRHFEYDTVNSMTFPTLKNNVMSYFNELKI